MLILIHLYDLAQNNNNSMSIFLQLGLYYRKGKNRYYYVIIVSYSTVRDICGFFFFFSSFLICLVGGYPGRINGEVGRLFLFSFLYLSSFL